MNKKQRLLSSNDAVCWNLPWCMLYNKKKGQFMPTWHDQSTYTGYGPDLGEQKQKPPWSNKRYQTYFHLLSTKSPERPDLTCIFENLRFETGAINWCKTILNRGDADCRVNLLMRLQETAWRSHQIQSHYSLFLVPTFYASLRVQPLEIYVWEHY